ncbi:hypothetical protein SAMN06265370_1146 [Puniceibacterium sediminis]|uniref:Uncharacterized protein n=1 Tax=Puniceibacterium sediminis TaxID=1608407 RepID=A0A238Y1J7_9RHOB|nr:hypothetical protein SAMN06265370_1146 [Puniceibacterium sediminis]
MPRCGLVIGGFSAGLASGTMTAVCSFLDPQVLAANDVTTLEYEDAIVSVIRVGAQKRRPDLGCGRLPPPADAVMAFRSVVHDHVAGLDRDLPAGAASQEEAVAIPDTCHEVEASTGRSLAPGSMKGSGKKGDGGAVSDKC